jgi:penicillin-binding protein 1A
LTKGHHVRVPGVTLLKHRLRLQVLAARFQRLRSWTRVLVLAVAAAVAIAVACAGTLLAAGIHYIYFDRDNLPEIQTFVRFDCPAIGHIYDRKGVPLVELSTEHRIIVQYSDIPPIVRDAILAAEDKNFFSHGGVDYSRIPRIFEKVRIGAVLTRFTRIGRTDKAESLVMLRQGGSTITQQLVRAYFLRNLTDNENGNQLRAGLLSYVVGARSAKKFARKLEEIRLSVWIEDEFTNRFGSKQRAKEEIFARYASFLYMGNGQYGFATAAAYYFGRPLSSFTADDADKAALLAGIAKSPLNYAPDSADSARVLHRRNQILNLMADRRSITPNAAQAAAQKPIHFVASHEADDDANTSAAPAITDSVLEELKVRYSSKDAEELLQGTLQVNSTADARLQAIANAALEHGLAAYEKRHRAAAGIVQGSVVVLSNADAGVLAEVGGRRVFRKLLNNHSDFNRATHSARQPGSAMKPIVYLAAFQQGAFRLESVVPDEPISVPSGNEHAAKSISNYDGRFKGMIPLRVAFAESRNAVAIWIAEQVGIDSVLRTAEQVGIKSKLQPYITTALGASEVTLLELASAYRTIASGTFHEPHLVREVSSSATMVEEPATVYQPFHQSLDPSALALLQEGMRGVVRLPTGTAHALDAQSFPIPVMGKTGTTSRFRDALFAGSTYGEDGITVVVRIGFDDDRTLGNGETGARVALPVFREILLAFYAQKLGGAIPTFPVEMEDSISLYLHPPPEVPVATASAPLN